MTEKTKTQDKRQGEKRIVGEMIALYCRHFHQKKGGLCPRCGALAAYAKQRVDHCPFMETKTFCSNCRAHCYRPEMREEIRRVMAWAGPRMLFHHPVLALRHLAESQKEKADGRK